MASGCEVGICPICGYSILEDEWTIFDDEIIHERCLRKATIRKSKMTDEHFEKISKIKGIQTEIDDLKTDIENNIRYYKNQLDELQERLDKLKEN